MHMTQVTALTLLKEFAKERNQAVWGHWQGQAKGSLTGMDWLPDALTRETLHEIYKVIAHTNAVKHIPEYTKALWSELEARYEYQDTTD